MAISLQGERSGWVYVYTPPWELASLGPSCHVLILDKKEIIEKYDERHEEVNLIPLKTI
jgi:hypothetical protein